MEINEQFFIGMAATKKDYILVCSTPVGFPLQMFLHTYIVAIQSGEIHRYEVFKKWGERVPECGCVYKDLFPAWVGNRVFIGFLEKLFGKKRWGCTLHAQFEIDVPNIEHIHLRYAHRHQYKYLSQNSNTYTSWLLKEMGLVYRLPFWAWGAR